MVLPNRITNFRDRALLLRLLITHAPECDNAIPRRAFQNIIHIEIERRKLANHRAAAPSCVVVCRVDLCGLRCSRRCLREWAATFAEIQKYRQPSASRPRADGSGCAGSAKVRAVTRQTYRHHYEPHRPG